MINNRVRRTAKFIVVRIQQSGNAFSLLGTFRAVLRASGEVRLTIEKLQWFIKEITFNLKI